MTTSRIPAGIADRFQRLSCLLFVAALALSATIACAQQSRLIGKWRSVDRGATLTMEFRANGQYRQTIQSGAATTSQSGPYKLAGSNRIAFSASGPAKTAQQIRQAGSLHTVQQSAMPFGARNSIVFKGTNRITITSESTHRSITLVREP